MKSEACCICDCLLSNKFCFIVSVQCDYLGVTVDNRMPRAAMKWELISFKEQIHGEIIKYFSVLAN